MEQTVTSFEFLVETFLPSLMPSLKKRPDAILEILFAFEFLKGFLKLKDLFLSPNLILFEDPDMNRVNIKELDATPGMDGYSFAIENQTGKKTESDKDVSQG